MTSPSAVLRVGAQSPRVSSVPEYVSSAGDEAIELAARAGLHLDPWQQLVLRESLGERRDGKWAAPDVGLVVPRQNGKGSILEARELAGLFLFEEDLIVHSAHQQRTSTEHFRRIVNLIEASEFSSRLKSVSRGKGAEAVELKSGQRIIFVTRTSGGGRGLTGNLIVLDEAMILQEESMEALAPTLAALSMYGNPQMWYAGSAVDQEKHEHGHVFARVRRRGLEGDPELAYFEWSADAEHPDVLTLEEAADPDVWATGNPGLAIRISEEYIAGERKKLSARGFAVERLGVGDWPADGDALGGPITIEMWTATRDLESTFTGFPCFSFDVTPDRGYSSISAAGRRDDGKWHVEVIEHRAGTGWLPDRLAQLVETHRPDAVVCDKRSPAAALLTKVKDAGVYVETWGPQELAEGAGALLDGLKQETVRHLGTPELTAAALGAAQRPLGDAWAWSRSKSSVDISPLVSVTLAYRKALEMSDTPFVFELLD